MKKIIIPIILSILSLSIFTGCLKRDSMENITIYTTAYPITYITNRLYENRAEIKSIYPVGVNINEYKLNNKQLLDYSNSDLFIFNGLSNEKDYVFKMLDNNKNMKIINSTLAMDYNHRVEELWLNPSNFLKISQNIVNGFNEYITNHYLKNEIKENYDKLEIDISNLDAEFNILSEAASNNKLVVSDDLWLFLSKYKFDVISLEENENLTDKKLAEVRQLITSKQINYIFVNEGEALSETVKKLKEETGISIIELHTLSNLSQKEFDNKNDYLSNMRENIESLKQELYN